MTLRVLPRSVKAQLSLAYLLARAADTVADTHLIEASRRRDSLLQIRKSIQESCESRTPPLPDFGDLNEARKAVASEGSPAERILLQNLGAILNEVRLLSAEDRFRICSVLNTITRGQELDLIRFGTATKDRIAALKTDEELDEYTYLVAGCVGEFWTHMCRAHIFPKARLDDKALFSRGILFGKGLQLVNILRDLPGDLRQGRCYIPEDQLSKHGLAPRDLLDASQMDRFRTLYDSYLMKTEAYLSAGWQYTTMLPFRHARVRLACAWPILIGMQTVEMLRRENVLGKEPHTHVPQADTWRLIIRSVLLYPNPKAWRGQFECIRLEEPGRTRKNQ